MANPETKVGIEDRDLDAKALVTGSTSGIGKQTALSLARLGCDVYVHGRDRDAGQSLVSQIQDMGQNSTFYRVDFSSQSEVKNFSKRVYNERDSLDILVNNAGGYFRKEARTEDDIEYNFAVNHLSHFILTRHLLPLLKQSEIGEIVNVSSVAHTSGKMNLEDVDGEGVKSGIRSYSRSKLANIHFTKSLDRRLQDNIVNVNAIHPGSIASSGFFRSLPSPLYKIFNMFGKIPIFTQPEDGSVTILYALLSPETEGESGNYYRGMKKSKTSELGRDKEVQKQLWTKSVELTQTDWDVVF